MAVMRRRDHLTGYELTVLGSLTDPVEALSAKITCELAAGHDEQHTAFLIATQHGDHWWIRWDAGQRALTLADFCDHHNQQSDDDCLLPKAHPGRYSFEFES
ncbi:hypothetical protein ACWT_5707 [Actinoplanes sp. SE50]|uniref:hypothetical protein n=1 Tax=unclassified Actinoplanes TaxID=2626549 RepID=UPI00023ED2E9|nr:MULTISPECIES: hypothetical protein [unclassified Actinoplanes]AEV86724.1 hypothetical protein ACPL_5837 [Actinoplanes sp. SE50/110]ATO85122.1 hypothetical protein ACWT_5707 [Actinoplanes sp. SE50]SLM02533.1 hypothetical protein ACSP50_5783 [Actinoplanes sp. SE50/110]